MFMWLSSNVLESVVQEHAAAPNDQAVYTKAEAARLKGVSYQTVSRAVRTGELHCTRTGRQILIPADGLEAWRPMVERRPRRYPERWPDRSVAPVAYLPAGAPGPSPRMYERVVPALVSLGEEPAPAAALGEILSTLAATLGCADAALIEWLPGNEGFDVRATVGAPRDWLSFQDAGPGILTRPIRIAGHPVGLFAGVPAADRTPVDEDAGRVALSLLTLAGVSMVWSSRF